MEKKQLYVNGEPIEPITTIRDGYTYTPDVDEAGNLSWSNDGNLPNPTPVNIKGNDGIAGRDGVDGITPTFDIGENGHWIINGADTGIRAEGEKGERGDSFAIAKIFPTKEAAVAGYQSIDEGIIIAVITSSGADVYIKNSSAIEGGGSNGKDIEHFTYFTALSDASVIKGEKGDAGKDGITPHIDATTGNWFLGITDTQVKAKGETGENGVSPHIDPATGNWFLGNVDTGVKAGGGGTADLSDEDREKLDAISITGEGKLFLTDSGGYENPDSIRTPNMTIQPMKKFELSVSSKGVSITFEEPDNTYDESGIMTVSISGIKIMKKLDQHPINQFDGEEVLDIDSGQFGLYVENGYIDNYVDKGEHWYYKAFPYSDTGRYGNNAINQASITIDVDVVRNYRYGFRINEADSNPATRVEYLGAEYKCMNSKFKSAYMDYTSSSFNYGDWEDAWFIADLKPCVLTYAGTVAYELNKNDYTLKADGTASYVTSSGIAGNVMVGIPTVYMKTWQEGTYRYCIVAKNEQEEEGFHAFAHTDANGNIIPYAYISAYKGYNVSSRLRSYSGVKNYRSTYATMTSYAEANNTSSDTIWNLETFCDRMLINMLLILMGKTTDMQTVFGCGFVNTTSVSTTGTLDKMGLFYGYSASTSSVKQVKVFGIEDWWGGGYNLVIGLMIKAGEFLAKYTYGTQDGTTVNGYNATGNGYINLGPRTAASSQFITSMMATVFGMIPGVYANGSSSTYYCDGFTSTVDGCCMFGSLYPSNNHLFSGPFNMESKVTTWSSFSASLSCKPLLTE